MLEVEGILLGYVSIFVKLNPVSVKNAITLAASLSAATIAFTASPAFAIRLLSFCGFFGGDPTATIDGTIELFDNGTASQSLFFSATTKLAGGGSPVTYDASNFLGGGPPAVVNSPGPDAECPGCVSSYSAYKYTFDKGGNILDLYFPVSIFPLTDAGIPGQPIDIVNQETRLGSAPRKDPDKLRQLPVPGPLPIFGAATAFGMSRRLRKRVREHQAQA
jgi:hypothetical protein